MYYFSNVSEAIRKNKSLNNYTDAKIETPINVNTYKCWCYIQKTVLITFSITKKKKKIHLMKLKFINSLLFFFYYVYELFTGLLKKDIYVNFTKCNILWIY